MKVIWAVPILASILILGATGFSSLPIVSAHGNVDQKNDGPGTFGGGVAISPTAQPLGQEFTPKVNNLIGVDIWLTQISAGTRDIIVTIWQGSINTGTSLGSSTRTITSDLSGIPGITDFHFDFVPTIPLIRGQLYTMQVEDPDTTGFIFGLSPVGGTNPYPRGDAITFGTPETFDFAFRTYFLSSAGGGKLIPPDELKSIALRLEQVDIVHTTDLAEKGQVITVIDFPRPTTIELLTLQSGILTSLGICDLPDGFVTQIRLVTTGASISFDSKTFSLKIPSGVLKFNGILTVLNDEDGVFGFDVEKSVIFTPSGFKLKSPIKFTPINADC